MKKNYFFSAALLLGAAALLSPVKADAAGWRNMNHLLKNVSGCDGWSGMLTGCDMGVGEFFPGAGMVYQVVRDLPAGEYTLTANGFYRNGSAPEAAKLHFAGKETNNAYFFINDTEVNAPSLFDGKTQADLFDGDSYKWGIVPNGLGEAHDAFAAGKYQVTVKATHKGGDMVIGFKYLGKTEGQLIGDRSSYPDCSWDGGVDNNEWAAFSNFVLKNANGDPIELASEGKFNNWSKDDGWNVANVDNGNKGRGLQGGCVWSKTNASVYNHSQTIEIPAAGKYRVGVQSFNQFFLGAHSGYFIPMKGGFYFYEGDSAYDLYKKGQKLYPEGAYTNDGNGKNFVTPVETIEAYVYINEGEKQNIGTLDPTTKLNVWLEPWTDDDNVYHPAPHAAQTKIKNLFDEELTEYPEIQNYKMANGDWKWVDQEGQPCWFESGQMREVAAFFVANQDLYQNYAELEFDKPCTITVGYNKDINQNNYAMPVLNFRLEYYDPAYTGEGATGGAAIETVEFDENAPVEYFNLQGVRVANPENGLYIVKQGNKVAKRIIK